MRLPNAEQAFVDREKVVEYLLNPAHRYGASKARFFGAFGFRVEDWETLARALREHGRHNEVKQVHQSHFGPRMEVEGMLPTPDGRNPFVRTVWQQDDNATSPRLITAYPMERER